jgi:hypothetical protein
MQQAWNDPAEVTTFSASNTLALHFGHLQKNVQDVFLQIKNKAFFRFTTSVDPSAKVPDF